MATIYGREIQAEVGSVIRPEKWALTSKLIASDWEAAAFRLPTHSGGPIESLSVNVTVTGKTYKRIAGDLWVRVKIEFVGDGEPSTFCGGWMLVGWMLVGWMLVGWN